MRTAGCERGLERFCQALQLVGGHQLLHALKQLVFFFTDMVAEQFRQNGKRFRIGGIDLACAPPQLHMLQTQLPRYQAQFDMAIGDRKEHLLFGIEMLARLRFVELAHVGAHALKFRFGYAALLNASPQPHAKRQPMLMLARKGAQARITPHSRYSKLPEIDAFTVGGSRPGLHWQTPYQGGFRSQVGGC